MSEIIVSILILIAIILLSLIGMILVRRSVSISTLESHHEVAGFIYAVVGVIYAVLVAFSVLVVWEQHNNAEERLEHEAASVSSIYRHSQGFHDVIFKNKVKDVVKEYSTTMIQNEFPAMSKIKVSDQNKTAYIKFWDLFYSYDPTNEHDKFWFDKSVGSLGKLQENRRLRILSVNFGVPGYMWFVLIFGAVITISFAYLFGTKRALAHGVMVFFLSGIIGLVLILIDSLEHPFAGIIYIESRAFVEVLKLVQ